MQNTDCTELSTECHTKQYTSQIYFHSVLYLSASEELQNVLLLLDTEMTRYEMKNHKFGKSFHPHAYHQLFAAHAFADALSSRLHCWDLFIFDIL